MKDSDLILVVIDPTSTKQHGLEQACVLADKLNKNLELFICTHDDSLKHYKNILGEEILERSKTLAIRKLTAVLEDLAQPLRQKGLNVCCDVSWDWPLDEGIIRKAMQSRPFMIIKDTHYHSKLSRLLFRNTDWSLIKHCPFPILFDKQAGGLYPSVILSAINPINDAEKSIDKQILKLGRQLSAALGSQHKLFHSVEPLTMSFVGFGGEGYSESLDQQNADIYNMHQNRLNHIAQEHGIKQDEIIFLKGDAKNLLPEVAASNNAGIVIMGSQTKSDFKSAFIGSTADAVLDVLNCDVLVLKPENFKTSVREESPPEYPQVVWPM